ncbi:MAG: hypothetical protein QW670_04825 [Candidatus Bathyarchaeia archaeon]
MIIVTCFIIMMAASTLISTSPITIIKPLEIGLAAKLPIFFWAGLLILGFLFYIGKESKYYLAIALILTILYLYVVPTLLKTSPSISPHSYYPFGESTLISSTGHLIKRSATLISYLYWPIFLYYASIFILLTGMSHHILLKYFPLLTIALYGLLVFLILRVKLKSSFSVYGTAWFLSSFFIRQHYFGPQGMAYIFFLLTLLLISWIFFDRRFKKRILIALLFFLSIITVITHPLTTFMSLMVIIALYATHQINYKRSSTTLIKLCLFLAVAFLSYNMFAAYGFFAESIQRYHNILLGMRTSTIYKEPKRIIGSTAFLINYASSWSIVFLNGLIALITVFLAVKEGVIRKDYFSFYLITLITLSSFGLTAEYGSHEAYQRAFMFGLVPLSFFCVSLLSRKPKILSTILVSLFLLNILAQYGSDTYRIVTESELNGALFFAARTPQKISVLYKFSPYIRYSNPLKQVKFLSLGTLPYTEVFDLATINKAINETDYIIFSNLQDNYYIFYLGATPFQQIYWIYWDPCFIRIYDSGNFHIIGKSNVTISP